MNLSDFKNKYSGRIFLIGSGPSINETPLELLQDEYTFAANSIPDVFSKTDWRPSFYTCVDKGVDATYCEQTIELGIPCFFREEFVQENSIIESGPAKNNIMTFKSIALQDRCDLDISTYQLNSESIASYHDVWSENITEVVYGYNTVMYHMMQISYYMGFDEIYLVGNDLYDVFDGYLIFPEAGDPATFEGDSQSTIQNGINFLQDNDHPVRSFINGLAYKFIKSDVAENILTYPSKYFGGFNNENYFSGNYSVGEIATPEKNRRHILAHELAKSVSNELGINIYNATVGGYLEVYPRVDITTIAGTDK